MTPNTDDQMNDITRYWRGANTTLELFSNELAWRGITTYTKKDCSVYGRPDFVFRARKVAVFLSEPRNDFHWGEARLINGRQAWAATNDGNGKRDSQVTSRLRSEGWKVLRFSDRQIEMSLAHCVDEVEALLRAIPLQVPFRTVDLCAGIGGIRRGFELTGLFHNVLSAETDEWACKTYEYIFGENPQNDVTSEDFKALIERTPYDVLLAGFPCQTFSRVGLEEGFENEEKGKIFHHIVEIIERTRPCAIFLENVDHLVTHDKGATFRFIILELETRLNYKVIGVTCSENAEFEYSGQNFIRNSRNFGVPQNRPRTYIIGFDRERFKPQLLESLPNQLPKGREEQIYTDLNDLLERDVEAKYYMASGYLQTLKRHRKREEAKGNGFGYRVVNGDGITSPIANTLLATGGSGKERNLIYDPREGIGGMQIKGKNTPLNDEGIRVMTPTEWGKLQGFINYAFLDRDGVEGFAFPEGISDTQQYKQFGNSVTIPAIEEMARFIAKCFSILGSQEG